jgi:hypothetical protein
MLISYTAAALASAALGLCACALALWCVLEIRHTRRVLRAELAAAASADLRRLAEAVHGARRRIDALLPEETLTATAAREYPL